MDIFKDLTQSQRIAALQAMPREERNRILKAQSEAAGDLFTGDPEFQQWDNFFDAEAWPEDSPLPHPSSDSIQKFIETEREVLDDAQGQMLKAIRI